MSNKSENDRAVEEEFSRLIDKSIEKVLDRFRKEIPMASVFLKGEIAEKLKKSAKEELEPLWEEIQRILKINK